MQLETIICTTALICFALSGYYTGMDNIHRNENVTIETLWDHCLRGNVVERSKEGCEPLAQHIIKTANQED